MKKKFFSKLLMVALVATVGVFSSCKDYDDDIADVRRDITQTATELRTDYTNKISLVNNSITELTKSLANLDEAYKAADAKLKSDLTADISTAVATAKAYSDANLEKAYTAAQAAQAAAAAYTDQQRAAAEAAALAAAKEQVNAAKAELQAALNEANKLIATQGETISNLLKADEKLTTAVSSAQARADQAYELAAKANQLAEQNKAAVEKAAADIAALQSELSGVKTANAADISKLQSDLAALQKQVSDNVVNLADYNTNLTQTTSDLAKLKENLDNQVALLGESIAAVKKTADTNVASIQAINEQLIKLQEYDKAIDAKIVESVNSLNALIEKNQGENATALKNAVEGIEAKLGALKTLVENNDAAIRTLIDTKASELKNLIDGNTAAIVKNAQDIEKNAKAQQAENVLMNNKIAKNAEDIIKQGKDITNLQDVVAALQTALGKETAATLKAYAESVAQTAADKAKLAAQGYADEKDAAQKQTIMQAITDQALADKAAWEDAISIAVGTLIETYQLNALAEKIKNAQQDAEANAKSYTDGQIEKVTTNAQTMANKALQDAMHYTDDLKTFLTTNYTNTNDMNGLIEAAKQSAIAQAFKNVMDALLADNTDWTKEGKVPTIAEEVAKQLKAFAEEAGYTNEQAAKKIAEDAIEAALAPTKYLGTDAEGNKLYSTPGVIMKEIEIAAKEAADALEGVDLRLKDVEQFLGATLNADGDTVLKGAIFEASVNALITSYKYATKAELEKVENMLKGTEDSKLKDMIDKAQADADQNGQDIQALMKAIENVNTKFTENPVKDASSEDEAEDYQATSHIDPTKITTFEGNIENLIKRVNAIGEVTDNLDEKVMELVNQNLAPVYEMITSINLFANQHQAHSDEMIIDGYTGYFKKGFDNYDHHLTFTFAVEQGKKDKAKWVFPDDYEFLGHYKVNGKFTFEDGVYRTYQDSILVRVNPVNADLSKATIGLLNSRGENIVDAGLVEVLGVKKYGSDNDKAVVTRAAAGNETGLWVIYFKLKDAKIASDFDKYAYAEVGKVSSPTTETTYRKQIVYAVAVKNSKDYKVSEKDEEGNEISSNVERWVVSEYDLDLNQEQAARDDRFFVDNVIIDSIHNRYIQTEEAQVGNTYWTDDKKNQANTYRKELVWNVQVCEDAQAEEEAGATPAKQLLYKTIHDYYCACYFDADGQWLGGDCNSRDGYMTKQGYTDVIWDKANLGWIDENTDLCQWNAVNRWGHVIEGDGVREKTGVDNRHLKPFLEIDFGDKQEVTIPIDFLDYNECGNPTPIKGFYVTLDQDFALESNNSEINAWVTYEYENVGYYKINEGVLVPGSEVPAKLQEGNHGYIKIFRKNNVKSDIIGFRVYAVNLDGTLYDPDGRAFYVKFGKNVINHSLAFDVLVENKDVDAKEVQSGDPNPIFAFNSNTDNDAKFFNIPSYSASYLPKYNYTVEYTWLEGNPAIRGKDASTALLWMVPGTYNQYTINDGETVYEGPLLGVDQVFNFEFSENENADKNDKTGNVDNKWKPFYGDGTTNPADVTPNDKTNSVRATIKKEYFNRLLDNATYKVRMTIKRNDPQTSGWTVVNVIDIDITKRMPTGLPTAFSVKSLQLDKEALAFYMRPDTVVSDGINPWMITWSNYEMNVGEDKVYDEAQAKFVDIDAAQKWQRNRWAVDCRPYTMEEIFNGLLIDDPNNAGQKIVDENYFFEIAKAGSRVDADYDAAGDPLKYLAADNKHKDDAAIVRFGKSQSVNSQTTATGDEPAYYLPKIHYSHINDGKHEVKAGYVYQDISATINPETGKFYNPTLSTRYGETSGMENQDLKINAIAFDANGNKTDGASKAQFRFDCGIGEALMLQEWSAKKGSNPTQKRFLSEIKYQKDAQIVLTKWMTAKADYETIGNANNIINGYTPTPTVDKFDGYTLDHQQGWSKRFIPGDKEQGYFDAQFDTNKWKSLTELLADSVLKVIDLDPSTIKFTSLKNNKDAKNMPTGSDLNYKVSDYFDYYYAGADANTPATKSSEITGIGFKLSSRTQLLPDLKYDVYGIISFPVYDVWKHQRNEVKLYVKFTKPANQASRQAR